MLRPPTSGGRGESDVHALEDAEIPAKRGPVEDLDQHPDSRQIDAPQGSGPGDDLPERLAERIGNGSSSSVAPGEPDVLPDVQVPDTTM